MINGLIQTQDDVALMLEAPEQTLTSSSDFGICLRAHVVLLGRRRHVALGFYFKSNQNYFYLVFTAQQQTDVLWVSTFLILDHFESWLILTGDHDLSRTNTITGC